ncbi:hypothetical protein HDV00_005721 [Rhizophlyctis rosea]|nr:hypothetical protein HDV00_005721 [Rhizophlyctis rosea]
MPRNRVFRSITLDRLLPNFQSIWTRARGPLVYFCISSTVFLGLLHAWVTLLPVPRSMLRRAEEGTQPSTIHTDLGTIRPRVASPWSDGIIGVSYFAIPLELSVFLWRLPKTSFYQKVVIVLFVCFIAFCGIGHLLDAAGADVKLVIIDRHMTAGVSALTALLSPIVLYYIAEAVLRAMRERELLRKQMDMLTDAQAMAHLGNWEIEIEDKKLGAIIGSDEWFRVLGIERREGEVTDDEAGEGQLSDESGDVEHGDSERTLLTGMDLESGPIELLLKPHHVPDTSSRNNRLTMEHLLTLIDEPDRDVVENAVRAAVEHGQIYHIETRGHRECDGRPIVIRSFGKPIYRDGQIVGLRGTAQDITEEVRKNRELSEAKDKAVLESAHKDIFLATMSHELRTPLTSIIGHIELIEETQLDERQRECVTHARLAAVSLLSLINDVLDYSKLVAGMIELEKQPIDIGRVLADLSVIAKTLRQDVKLTLQPYRGPVILADATRLRQILVNLVGNALKFTHAGRTVTVSNRWDIVSTRSKDGMEEPSRCRVTVTVEDTGIGMSPEVMSRLFTPFSQGDSSTSRRFGGTGLGLSIVKKILDAMEGTIVVRSTEGVGSTFEVTFETPLATGCAMSNGQMEDTRVGEKPGVRRVLLAEDNIIIQKLVRQMLGHVPVVDAVDNGAEAVQFIQSRDPYDVLLCDLNMPIMDGLEATKQIRALEKGRRGQLRIIGLTANAFKSDKEACFNAGMDDFLSKPFKKSALLAAVEAVGLAQSCPNGS